MNKAKEGMTWVSFDLPPARSDPERACSDRERVRSDADRARSDQGIYRFRLFSRRF